jgi:hypothetical protein
VTTRERALAFEPIRPYDTDVEASLSAIAAVLAVAALSASCAAMAPPASKPDSSGGMERSRRLIAEAFGGADYRTPDEALALAAERGELESASAAWWGFDSKDSTRSLRAALASGARTVLVPAMASPWRTGPLRLRGSLTLILEPGAEIAALEGAFRGSGDCLLEAEGAADLAVIGYGARLSMRKEDYRRPPYEDAQWRHALSLRETLRTRVSGLSIEGAGGDGIYIGQRSGRPVPEDLVLEDLRIRGCYRQGISVVSARGLRILRCDISGTSGHLPGAGIDFEPNSELFGFEDCLVSSCSVHGNAGPALQVYLATRSAEERAVSIEIRDCVLRGFPYGLFVGGLGDGARGTLLVAGSRVSLLVRKDESRGFALKRIP